MRRASFICLAVAAGLLAGCAGAQKKSDRPDWVMKGAGAFSGEKKKFYGVGIAEGIKSEALRRTTADNRGIAEISRQLTVLSTALMRDYMSATTDMDKGGMTGEQYVENTAKTFTSNTLAGVKVIDRWDNGQVTYSLVELSLDDLKNLADQANQLSAQVRDYIKANAEKAFDQLDAEESKRK